mmetsp:Transcript_33812/g.81362  ORF Transcript_33812/g.81362 Transcript_33812/m.81362 type:complete len:80 (+) Transcript_33812:1834-2073(+)
MLQIPYRKSSHHFLILVMILRNLVKWPVEYSDSCLTKLLIASSHGEEYPFHDLPQLYDRESAQNAGAVGKKETCSHKFW